MNEPSVLRPETKFAWRRWVNLSVLTAGFWQLDKITTAMGRAGSHAELEGVAGNIVWLMALSLILYLVAPTAEQLAKIKWMGRAFSQSPQSFNQGYGCGYNQQSSWFEPEPDFEDAKGGS
ncbi:MAG: hypothetical protein KDE32_10135 [Novosphingobium sp.]|nr:hypothetical protein [Novosphingobium sp.]